MYKMEMLSGEILNFMKNEIWINSEQNDGITIIASAEASVPGHISICSGDSIQDKQFRYSKCEVFTVSVPKENMIRIEVQAVRVHYSYLFQKTAPCPIREVLLSSDKKVVGKHTEQERYKNQNIFHYTAPIGWMNDPVGLCFYHGLYHMFYQFNPAAQRWGDMFWGHATSIDMIHWRDHPIVLMPQLEITCNPSVRGGAFSGTALIEKNTMHLFFSRHIGDLQKEHCLEYTATVESKNGFDFSGESIVVKDLPTELGENFRDPKVWREKDEWLMLTGTETYSGAAIAVHRSVDLKYWEYKGIFYREEDARYLRAECPSIMRLGEKYVLIIGYHNADETQVRRDTVYYIGTIKNYYFHAEQKGLLDYGKDFYAAQMFANIDQPVMIAWENDRYEYHIESLCRSNGTMSLPRKLWIEKEKLYSYPIEAMKCVEKKEGQFKNIFRIPDGRGHLHIIFSQKPSGYIRIASSEAGEIAVSISSNQLRITTDKEVWSTDIHIEELDVYSDCALFEIFLNHGEQAFTRRYDRYDTDYEIKADLSAGCSASFYKIEM